MIDPEEARRIVDRVFNDADSGTVGSRNKAAKRLWHILRGNINQGEELSVIEKQLPNGMRDFYEDRRRFNELVSHHGYRAEVVKYVRLVKDEYSPLGLRKIDES